MPLSALFMWHIWRLSPSAFGTPIALTTTQENLFMIRAAIGFFILGLLAIALGAGNVGGLSIEVGKTLLFVFIVLAVLSALVGLISGRSPKILP
jgi:uncharacterized membrane protein YtjA (UPF0391 family)